MATVVQWLYLLFIKSILGYAITVPESIPEEASESDEIESTDKSETPEPAANHEKEPKV